MDNPVNIAINQESIRKHPINEDTTPPEHTEQAIMISVPDAHAISACDSYA
jgi:hypothetical protein